MKDTRPIKIGNTGVTLTGEKDPGGTWRGSGTATRPPWSDVTGWVQEKLGVHLPKEITDLRLEALLVELTQPPSGSVSYYLALTVTFPVGALTPTLVIAVDHQTAKGNAAFRVTASLNLTTQQGDVYTFSGDLTVDKTLAFSLRWNAGDEGVPLTSLAKALGLDLGSDDLPAVTITGATLLYRSASQTAPYGLAASFTSTAVAAAAVISG
ncbi:hypothetical protein ACFU99_04545 [Streptomyces sp. NPDC057654]|uniref:hypothetical protein n=1 Tax=Streptomyces sp. NPDC057654 TaxID=3346196 RepID=UPI003699641B